MNQSGIPIHACSNSIRSVTVKSGVAPSHLVSLFTVPIFQVGYLSAPPLPSHAASGVKRGEVAGAPVLHIIVQPCSRRFTVNPTLSVR